MSKVTGKKKTEAISAAEEATINAALEGATEDDTAMSDDLLNEIEGLVDAVPSEAVASTTEEDHKPIQGDVTEENDLPEQGDITATEATTEATSETTEVVPEAPTRKRPAAGSPKSVVLASKLEGVESAHELFAFKSDEAELPEDALRARQADFLTRVDGMKKKIAEKAVNTIQAVAGKGSLSVYTQIAFNALSNADGKTITSKELVSAYLDAKKPNSDEGYDLGTARAQANQMFHLFPELGIATRDKGVLTMNDDSVMAVRLSALVAAPVAEAA